MSTRIYVGGLPSEWRDDDVRRVFADKAPIREVDMKHGYCFVEFNDPSGADSAVRDMEGYDLGNGRKLSVGPAHAKKPREDRERRYDDRRGGDDRDRRGGYDRDDRRGGYEDRRGGYDRDDRRGSFDDRRGGLDRDRRDDRRGGYDRDDRRGGYDDRRGGHDDRRGGYDDRRGGYDRRDNRGTYDRRDRNDRTDRRKRTPPHNSEWGMIVDGLPAGTTWSDLKDHFRPAGPVCYTGLTPKGQGIVQFKTEEGLLQALKTFDGAVFRGSTITLTRGNPELPVGNDSGPAPSSSDARNDNHQRSPSPYRPDSPRQS